MDKKSIPVTTTVSDIYGDILKSNRGLAATLLNNGLRRYVDRQTRREQVVKYAMKYGATPESIEMAMQAIVAFALNNRDKPLRKETQIVLVTIGQKNKTTCTSVGRNEYGIAMGLLQTYGLLEEDEDEKDVWWVRIDKIFEHFIHNQLCVCVDEHLELSNQTIDTLVDKKLNSSRWNDVSRSNLKEEN